MGLYVFQSEEELNKYLKVKNIFNRRTHISTHRIPIYIYVSKEALYKNE